MEHYSINFVITLIFVDIRINIIYEKRMVKLKNTVIVIGAGPAGMMAAGTAASKGSKVILIEKNNRVGRKLMITGKGRCNITNNCNTNEFIESVTANSKFLYSAINKFNCQDTMLFFENNGLKLKVERGNRVFPESDRAMDVVNALHRFCISNNVNIINKRVLDIVVDKGSIKGVLLDRGEKLFGDKVIIACGGMSYPVTGSNGDGYALAQKAGHEIIEPKPSLVPLISKDKWCKDLQGLSLKNVSIKVKANNKVIYEDFGEMLFTHFGLSGPIILSASAHMRGIPKISYNIVIDLKPALTEEKLDARIQRDFSKFSNKALVNALSELLPRKMIPVVIKLLKIDPYIKCNQITKENRKKLVLLLKNFVVQIDDFRGIEEAIVTSGGVNTSEISPKTMESKLLRNLYFAGEVIDVDAYTGGFNLQIAFSTGYLSGISASERR